MFGMNMKLVCCLDRKALR